MTDRPEPETSYAIEGEWLVEHTNGCTCDPHMGHHHSYCGSEPIARVSEVLEALKQAEKARFPLETFQEPPVLCSRPESHGPHDDGDLEFLSPPCPGRKAHEKTMIGRTG